jgi:TfoX/Sxy family transcriptional regulator of competence genes
LSPFPQGKKSQREPGAWSRSSAQAQQAFERTVATLPDVEPKKMFGCPCAFVNGQMFALLFADRWVLRLPQSDRERWTEAEGAHRFEPQPGRVMKEYVTLPADISPRQLGTLLSKAHGYARTHPRRRT